ncbi:MAG: LD-carboxypeptidase [Lachnospiraceae bacterium]|nr:LD-carboxypeptidase [Lachnospiraceae bacterium]
MNPGDKIGILCCSNGQKKSYKEKLDILTETLSGIGLVPVYGKYIYEKEDVFCASGEERAKALTEFYLNDEIKAIFDISGGDLANGILPYTDYDVIAESDKTFWGYSDLTTVINAIYQKTGKVSVLYQIRNLIYTHKETQIELFRKALFEGSKELFSPRYEFVRGDEMQGIVVGGNIRCFLKLAGTEYMPDTKGKILLLEGYTGTVAKMETYLCQLKQLGILDNVSGIILGTFTEMEKENCVPDMPTLVKRKTREDIPIAQTREIGHGTDSKALIIGKEIYWKR